MCNYISIVCVCVYVCVCVCLQFNLNIFFLYMCIYCTHTQTQVHMHIKLHTFIQICVFSDWCMRHCSRTWRYFGIRGCYVRILWVLPLSIIVPKSADNFPSQLLCESDLNMTGLMYCLDLSLFFFKCVKITICCGNHALIMCLWKQNFENKTLKTKLWKQNFENKRPKKTTKWRKVFFGKGKKKKARR